MAHAYPLEENWNHTQDSSLARSPEEPPLMRWNRMNGAPGPLLLRKATTEILTLRVRMTVPNLSASCELGCHSQDCAVVSFHHALKPDDLCSIYHGLDRKGFRIGIAGLG
jgi:hypothetical protein